MWHLNTLLECCETTRVAVSLSPFFASVGQCFIAVVGKKVKDDCATGPEKYVPGRCVLSNPSVRILNPFIDCDRRPKGVNFRPGRGDKCRSTTTSGCWLSYSGRNEQVLHVRSSLPRLATAFHVPTTTMTSSTTASQTEAKQARIPIAWRDQCSS